VSVSGNVACRLRSANERNTRFDGTFATLGVKASSLPRKFFRGFAPSLPTLIQDSRGSAPSPEIFLFCDLEMAYFGEFWSAKFKVGLCNNVGGYSH